LSCLGNRPITSERVSRRWVPAAPRYKHGCRLRSGSEFLKASSELLSIKSAEQLFHSLIVLGICLHRSCRSVARDPVIGHMINRCAERIVFGTEASLSYEQSISEFNKCQTLGSLSCHHSDQFSRPRRAVACVCVCVCSFIGK